MTDSQQRQNTAQAPHVFPELQHAPKIASPATGVGDIVPTGAVKLDEAHRSFAEFHRNYVGGYIALADTKASWVFAIAAGLLVYVCSNREITGILLLPGWNIRFVLTAITVPLLILAGAFSFLVISPRFTSSGEGIVFFSAVARKASADAFVHEIASLNDSALTEARLKNTYDASRICAQKYTCLRLAFWLGVLGLIGMGGIILVK